MHILNAFGQATSSSVRRLRSSLSGDLDRSSLSERDVADQRASRELSAVTEDTTLLESSQRSNNGVEGSLTAEFEDFAHSSRALWICLAHATVYYSFAVLGFSLLVEKWTIINSLYFATVLFTTIGYGDMAPTTPSGQVYAICLALYGIVILGIFLGVAGEIVLDARNAAMEQQHNDLQATVISTLTTSTDPSSSQGSTNSISSKKQEKSWWEDVVGIIVMEAPIIAILIVVSLAIGHAEGWSAVDSLYWLAITGTTVGLGDFHPNVESVRLFCCFFLPLSVAVLGELLARIATVYMDRKTRAKEKAFMSRCLSLTDLSKMDEDGSGEVDKAEFLSYMLVALQKCTKEDIREVSALFHKLDVSGDGNLSKKDLVAGSFGENFRQTMQTQQ